MKERTDNFIKVIEDKHSTEQQNMHSNAHGTYTKIVHILDHKTDLNMFKITEIIINFVLLSQ